MTTYTSTLRLALMVTGDPAIKSSWGPIYDASMSMIDAADSGLSVVSINGLTTYALTTANNAADQARPKVQQYTGALTQACTVTLPNVPKIGYAQNNTTGGFNVVLTAGAGTTATIPADGSWHLFQTDGATNVTLPLVTFGPPTAPGSVNGTTGTFTGAVSTGPLTVTGAGAFSGAVGTGPLTITGAASATGAYRGAGYFVNSNGQLYQAKDAGNTDRPILGIDTQNFTDLLNGGGVRIRLMNQAGTREWLSMDDVGNVFFTQGGLASPISSQLSGSTWSPTTGWNINGTSVSAMNIGVSGPALTLMGLFNNGLQVGSVTTAGGFTAFNTSSDARLKIDAGLIDPSDAVHLLMGLKARWFRWKATRQEEAVPGFFAQQVHRWWPWAVTKGKGREGRKGYQPWQMDNSKLVPLLTTALQEALRRIDALERRR